MSPSSVHAMTSITLLTPDPLERTYAAAWPGLLQLIRDALALEGITVVPTPWTAHVDDAAGLRDAKLVLPLLAWGYHAEHDRWLRACRTWMQAGVRLANPVEVLQWNSDKHYLARFAREGIGVPPTTWTDAVTQAQVEAVFEATGAAHVIVKPTVSGGAWKTLRLRPGEALFDAPTGAAMLQPYLSTIESAGETSLLFFGGRLSHVVNKRPVAGEFRVQSQFGGDYTVLDAPPPDALELAQRVLAAIDAPLLYARVDMVPDEAGRWLLMELELIEPDLYMAVDPAKGAGFAAAVRARLDAGNGVPSSATRR